MLFLIDVVAEEIWRSRADAAKKDIFLIPLYLIRVIAADLNVKRRERDNGRGKSWQRTVPIGRIRMRPRGSGAAEIRITGRVIARGIRPMRSETALDRGSETK